MRSRVVLLLLVLLAAGPLLADEMAYNFTTTGSFGDVPPNLTFNAQTLAVTGTTSGGAASPLALGSFVLTRPRPGETDTYDNQSFTLDVLFALPTDIVGGSAGVFNALLNGTIKRGSGATDLDLVFAPSSEPFTFNNGVTHGLFTFGITNGGISNMDYGNGNDSTSKTYALTGYIQDARQSDVDSAVPEPGSIVLLATVLGGAVFSLRRKYSV